jgi:hypothetical protein
VKLRVKLHRTISLAIFLPTSVSANDKTEIK